MTVLLRQPDNLPDATQYDLWCACLAKEPDLKRDCKFPDIIQELMLFGDEVVRIWLEIGYELSQEDSAKFSHTSACVANASDFGYALSWSLFVESQIKKHERLLVICGDPWMFRQLAQIDGIEADDPPSLFLVTLAYWVRGYLARIKVALRLFFAAIRYRKQRDTLVPGSAFILVYGHPSSDADGFDGYFGEVLQDHDKLFRVLHVDCLGEVADRLSNGVRTVSLHAWGNPLLVFSLIWKKWRPDRRHRSDKFGWLIRRAGVFEGSRGQAAMICWQQICQRQWLKVARPRVVSWPWENHAWERDFVRAASAQGVETLGYQHSTVGRQAINYSYASNPDGLASIPARVFCSGEAGRERLISLGFSQEMLSIGGALRIKHFNQLRYDPRGPIYFALPFDHQVCREMVAAAKSLNLQGKKILVKDHPMTPFEFEDSGTVVRTSTALNLQEPLSAVIYSSSTVGLEALFGGLPTLQFITESRIPNDILPNGITVPYVTRWNIEEQLKMLVSPYSHKIEDIFSEPNTKLWTSALAGIEN